MLMVVAVVAMQATGFDAGGTGKRPIQFDGLRSCCRAGAMHADVNVEQYIDRAADRMIRLAAYIDQINSGRRNQVCPGARIVWVVTMKFSPVRIDEKPATNTPTAVAMT